MMVTRLFGPFRALNLRSPAIRYLPAALCMLLIFLATLRSDRLHIRSQLLPHAGMMGGSVVHDKIAPIEKTALAAESSNETFLSRVSGFNHGVKMDCSADLARLIELKERYQLETTFQYTKRYLRFHRKQGLERKRMTKLSQKFLSDSFMVVDLDEEPSYDEEEEEEEEENTKLDNDDEDDVCDEPLEVDVPASPFPRTVNASDFIFGVSTTYQRFKDPATTPIQEWAYWLTDGQGGSNGGKLLLMLLGAREDELQEVANMLGDAGIDADVYQSEAAEVMAVRYFNLVPTLFMHPGSETKKWFVTCDDDTFFPSMHALVATMATFDPTAELYIGTLSEDVGAVERHGSQAFGGAGVFLSRPLAERLTSLQGSCTSEARIVESDSGWGPQGDSLLRNCIYQNTQVRLTTLPDLWQLDFLGDPAGFYEWGHKPLSLHHYRGGGWHKAKPAQYAQVAHSCGEDCTLMRFQTADDFVISGYSIAQYPFGIGFDTNQMEATLFAAPENRGWNLDFAFGPQRSSLSRTGRKMAWELQESSVRRDGSVIQTYVRRQDDQRWVNRNQTPMSAYDGVIELVWIPG